MYNLQMFLDLIFLWVKQTLGHQWARSEPAIKSELTLQIPALIEMIKSYRSINPALDFRQKIVQFNYWVKFTLSNLPVFAIMS